MISPTLFVSISCVALLMIVWICVYCSNAQVKSTNIALLRVLLLIVIWNCVFHYVHFPLQGISIERPCVTQGIIDRLGDNHLIVACRPIDETYEKVVHVHVRLRILPCARSAMLWEYEKMDVEHKYFFCQSEDAYVFSELCEDVHHYVDTWWTHIYVYTWSLTLLSLVVVILCMCPSDAEVKQLRHEKII